MKLVLTETDRTETERRDREDIELIARVRAGDEAAYADLYARHFRSAYAVACSRAGAHRADDLVADAFLAVYRILRRGQGPDRSFRSYLHATVRTLHLVSLRSSRRELLVDDYELVQAGGEIADGMDGMLDGAAIVRSLRSLPGRWQTVLWLTAVEERSHEEIGEILDIRPSAVAALAFRAREGLRRAYLADHVGEQAEPGCSAPRRDLPAYLRGTLGASRRGAVEQHLRSCASCLPVIDELRRVNRSLSAVS